MRVVCLIAVIAVVAVAAACVEKPGGGQKKIDPAYVQKNLLAEEPAMANRVNADLGGKVVYLGNDLDKKVVRPGDVFTVVHYWKVAEPPGPEWRVFSHVVGEAGAWMNVDYTDMRAGHPPAAWKPGQIIRDEQRIQLAADWKSPYAQVTVGLYPRGGQGAKDRMMVVSGPHDDESRVLAARVEVLGAASPGAYTIRKTAAPIAIDGKADEEAWKSAPQSPAFVTPQGGKDMKQRTTARLLWDDSNLYAFIEVEDSHIESPYHDHDDSLWKADVVELFIDADGNKRGYVELQVNPNNAQFDAWFPQTRGQQSFFDWNAGMTSAVGAIEGGWTAEIAIPLAAVKGRDDAMKVTIPPAVGDTWKLNVVRVDLAKGAKQINASSWNQITIQDFHALDRMLTVTFGDAEGKTEPESKEAATP